MEQTAGNWEDYAEELQSEVDSMKAEQLLNGGGAVRHSPPPEHNMPRLNNESRVAQQQVQQTIQLPPPFVPPVPSTLIPGINLESIRLQSMLKAATGDKVPAASTATHAPMPAWPPKPAPPKPPPAATERVPARKDVRHQVGLLPSSSELGLGSRLGETSDPESEDEAFRR